MEASKIIERAQRLANRVDPDFDDRCYQFLNEGMREWALTHPWATLHRTIDLTCDGSSTLVLPPYVLSIRSFADKSNKHAIDAHGNWDRQAVSAYMAGTSGAARWWQPDGVQAVFRQPTVQGYVSVRSNVSEAHTAYVAGIVFDSTYSGTAGEYRVEQETLDYLSATGATSSNQYEEILSFGKSARSNGRLDLFSDGDRLLSSIPADQYEQPYRRVKFLFIPTAGTIMRTEVILNPPEIHEQHQHPHPSVDSEYLVWYVAALIHRSMGQEQRSMMAMAQATAKLNRKANFEQLFGDRDWGSAPDYVYWTHENDMAWNPEV